MSNTALVSTLAMVLVAVLLSLWQQLRLERDLLVGTVRTFVQLLAIGYVLAFVFQQDRWYFTAGVLLLMTLVATHNAAGRGKGVPGIFWRVMLAIGLGETVTLGIMLLLHIIEGTPRFVIPVAGMIVGNAMVAAGLVLNRFQADIRQRRPEVEAALALGASPRQAVEGVLQTAVKGGMIPTIDSMKTVGLVALPGMMTGSILAGADPLLAVKYQIMVMLMLSSATALSSITLGFILYPAYFNQAEQLVIPVAVK
ncbi:iron export ABC transporter permease subunit FetB [Desulfofundulus thermobenzoicus]|uniref:Iron export ABC transporter permease subunit FetB n=1 Tax=Desulfofundulus thermobenzoicus TaxID=29376 RepID=A0A6N7ITE6_9FIRM|nr:iron export ABC transporter permease subunit FetB [Desulfofundulus thermobenzoicus]MQL52833.1 iron export ABC transporter permease subunit FetB [Desulfofundulus thermobenzoicus]HHW43203.1 iron export ABC transporter permease subunit FetB [Desulfotomaculum sp.]